MTAEPDIVEPVFDGVARHKLASLLSREWSICGYAIQKGDEYGLVTTGAFVGWWTVAANNAEKAEAEVTRLRTALATEYARGMEDAAKVTEAFHEIVTVGPITASEPARRAAQALILGDIASAIRALVPKP